MANLPRRQFLGQTAAAISLAAASEVLQTRPAVAAENKSAAANERIRVGCIGVGGRAGFLLKAFAGQPDVEIRMICDVDTNRLPAAITTVESIRGQKPEVVSDFRRVIDNPQLDVVVVGTPDHWHAIPTILACQAGKDVYVEKPDGHNIVEGQRMVAAQRKHQRIVQLGTQARTSPHFHEAIAYIKSGKLGKCLVAKAWESSKQGSIGRPADSPPPPGVDYDLWLGPAPLRPFNARRFHGNWRWFFDYGTGDLGNDGVHRLDVARWALSTAVEAQGGAPLVMPQSVSAHGGKWYFDDMQEWPDTLQVNYEFAGQPGRLLTYEMRVWAPYPYLGEAEGAAVFGDQGHIIIGNSRWQAFDAKRQVVAEGSGKNDGTEHIRNFLDCVKSRQKPNADLETVGHPSSVLCHAGNIAWRTGHRLVFDSTTETIVNDADANALRSRPVYRAPYSLPDV